MALPVEREHLIQFGMIFQEPDLYRRWREQHTDQEISEWKTVIHLKHPDMIDGDWVAGVYCP